ncbi:hypothetical protein D781_1571 [Serratia sp. FGI94]|uniref:lipoprotein n=1 Tax=Serratia sp. FGI94 TaxID=671990 RepID=UPI0002A73949|nr:lipoprotein [Serratia sp. FGI94]AGB81872.1 hypothetical protein D781_1571 [Serratia sp. FGI94]
MKTKTIAAVLPLAALALSACTTVEPAYKDIGARSGACIEGGPDSVAQKFYDLRLEQGSTTLPDSNRLAQLQPYLSQPLYQELLSANQKPQANAAALFTGNAEGATSASVASASSIPNTDAKNIPLRVQLSDKKDDSSAKEWQNEVLMVREGTCWVVDDIRYLNVPPHAASGTLRQVLEND